MTSRVKLSDVVVQGWCGYTWSVAVKAVGRTIKVSEVMLQMSYIGETNMKCTFLQLAC